MLNEIILYSTNCPRCKILKEKLDSANINYVEENDVDIMLSLSMSEVPQLKINDNIYNFTKAMKWITNLGSEQID